MSDSLRRAQELLDGMEYRHRDRLRRDEVGEWQTEINEVYRILTCLLEAQQEGGGENCCPRCGSCLSD